VLAWVAAEIFPHVPQLTQGQGPGDDLCLSPAMTLAHHHPSRSNLLSLRLSLVLQGRLLLAQVGHWAQPPCLLLELGLEQLPCQANGGRPCSCGSGSASWGGCDCLLGWRGCRAGWGGSASRNACRFVSPPFPFKAMNSVEQGSVGVRQTPAHCGDLCLSSSQGGSTLFADILLVCPDSVLVQG